MNKKVTKKATKVSAKKNATKVVVKKKEPNVVGRIIIGLIIGIVLGLFVHKTGATWLGFVSILGELYILSLKAIAPILVFILVIDSLASSSGSKKQTVGIKRVIILYLVSSLAASTVAVIASFMFKVTMPGLTAVAGNTASTSLYDSIKTVLLSVVSNPIKSIAEGNYLPILFWAIIFGFLANKLAGNETKKVIRDSANVITNVIQSIIKLAPLGVLGLSFTMVAENGASIFVDYGKLIALLVIVMLIIALIVNPIIVFIATKKNPYPLVFKCLARSGINAFFTRSSAANIPINMELCDEMKLDQEIYSVTIPLGATINMAGAAAVITIMTLSTCWTLGMNVSIGFAFFMCFISTIAAAGSAGTAGGSLMLIPLACSLFGIGADIAWYTVGVGGTIGVIQDSVETAVNSSSDVVLTATADMMEDSNKKKK